jgi:hypothetical protein
MAREGDPVFLQVREARASVLEPYAGNSRAPIGLVVALLLCAPTIMLLDERNARGQLVADNRPNLVLDLDVACRLRCRERRKDLRHVRSL